jgi:hypothetical protein
MMIELLVALIYLILFAIVWYLDRGNILDLLIHLIVILASSTVLPVLAFEILGPFHIHLNSRVFDDIFAVFFLYAMLNIYILPCLALAFLMALWADRRRSKTD